MAKHHSGSPENSPVAVRWTIRISSSAVWDHSSTNTNGLTR